MLVVMVKVMMMVVMVDWCGGDGLEQPLTLRRHICPAAHLALISTLCHHQHLHITFLFSATVTLHCINNICASQSLFYFVPHQSDSQAVLDLDR